MRKFISLGWVGLSVLVLSAGAARADECSSARILYDYARTLNEGGSTRLNVLGVDAGICQKYLADAEKRRADELVKEKGFSPEMAKREAMMDQAKVALYAAVQSKKDCDKLAKGLPAPLPARQVPRALRPDSSAVRR